MIWPASREFVDLIDVIEWRVTQLPKVGTPPYVLEAAAPRVGDDTVRSRPYAGKPVNPPLLVVQMMNRSDNVRGAENQQERLWIPSLDSRESSETIRRPSRRECGEMMRWSDPHGDMGRLAETSGPPARYPTELVNK
jgi:hypothetical protein